MHRPAHFVDSRSIDDDEYELPATEALLAGTMALMTGYAQALQAERDPAQRLAMSRRIEGHLDALSRQAALSSPFRTLSGRLSRLWEQIAQCTAQARGDCEAAVNAEAAGGHFARPLH